MPFCKFYYGNGVFSVIVKLFTIFCETLHKYKTTSD